MKNYVGILITVMLFAICVYEVVKINFFGGKIVFGLFAFIFIGVIWLMLREKSTEKDIQ